jgi:hypothetical protein
VIEVGFAERERFVDAQPCIPEAHDQAAQPLLCGLDENRKLDNDHAKPGGEHPRRARAHALPKDSYESDECRGRAARAGDSGKRLPCVHTHRDQNERPDTYETSGERQARPDD